MITVLTPLQVAIMVLLRKGLDNKQIAARLRMTQREVAIEIGIASLKCDRMQGVA